ncbi:tetratricopeptide repeat protein 27-like [Oncorhynchus masou masou]|uniref:tetratricopeptide repeat protein 27-like n=1 Tax=Oncorhynchus masou masou TaxID=90313 RepID=UPI0031845B69
MTAQRRTRLTGRNNIWGDFPVGPGGCQPSPLCQSNWTGPPVTIHVPDLLAQALLSSFTEPGALTSALLGSLLLDGESVYRLVWNPFLLLASIKLVNYAIKLDSLQ